MNVCELQEFLLTTQQLIQIHQWKIFPTLNQLYKIYILKISIRKNTQNHVQRLH